MDIFTWKLPEVNPRNRELVVAIIVAYIDSYFSKDREIEVEYNEDRNVYITFNPTLGHTSYEMHDKLTQIISIIKP